MVSEGKIVFPIYADEKVFPPTFTTAGVKIFWQQVRSGLWAIRPDKLAPMKWLTLKKKTKLSFRRVEKLSGKAENGSCSGSPVSPNDPGKN
jgi:hypothetical protein